MPARHIDDIRKRRPLDKDARQRVETFKRAMQLDIALAELRELRGVSQADVAERLDVALGGRLEIRAVFDDDAVELT
jgi:hypothetical protein